jgi:hypothetical protein
MKKRKSTLTPKLRQNWWIDMLLGLSAVMAVLSSIYFLVYPVGGYQGGRNPSYNTVLVFDRRTWDILHTWMGVAMIAAALVHVIIHWTWITGTISRTWQVITGKRKGFGLRLTYNILLDAVIALSFLVCAVSGVYFMYFAPSGSSSQSLIFSNSTWDLIHTWSGIVMVIAAVLHFALHWKWVTIITTKVFGTRNSLSMGLDDTRPVEVINPTFSK